jgi:hypothetical protein
MEESRGHRGTHRGSTIAEAMSHSMLHASMLGQEELRIFDELISRFDTLSEIEKLFDITRVNPTRQRGRRAKVF